MGDQIDDSTLGSGSFMGLGYSYSGNQDRRSSLSSEMQQSLKQQRYSYEQQRFHPANNYNPASNVPTPLSFSPPFQEFQSMNWNSSNAQNVPPPPPPPRQSPPQQQQQQQTDWSDRRDRPNEDYAYQQSHSQQPNRDTRQYEYDEFEGAQQQNSHWQQQDNNAWSGNNTSRQQYEQNNTPPESDRGAQQQNSHWQQQDNNAWSGNNNSSRQQYEQNNTPPESDRQRFEGPNEDYQGPNEDYDYHQPRSQRQDNTWSDRKNRQYEDAYEDSQQQNFRSQQQNNNAWSGNNNGSRQQYGQQQNINNTPPESDRQRGKGPRRGLRQDCRERSQSWPDTRYSENEDRPSRSRHRSRWGREKRRRPSPPPLDDPQINETTASYGKAIQKRSRVLPPVPPPPPPQFSSVPRRPKVNIDELGKDARLGRHRALEIIDMLQQQKEDDLNKLSRETLVRKRKECLEKLKEREHIALLKNLEYVARVEDERLQERLARVQEAQEYHYQLEDYHNQVLELRNKNALNTQAGIGTDTRQRAEKKRKQHTQHVANDSLSIYVSNLPTDGSASDELMQALFGSYGTLRKIHLYRDKQTGDLKGDALVIYDVGEDGDRSTLTEAVCSQMNGAELPCGTPIKVEPSDPLYQLRKKKQTNYYGSASQQEEENDAESEKKIEEEKIIEEKKIIEEEQYQGNITPSSRVPTDEDGSPERGNSVEKPESQAVGDDDDLDDFFDSLE